MGVFGGRDMLHRSWGSTSDAACETQKGSCKKQPGAPALLARRHRVNRPSRAWADEFTREDR